MRLLPIFFVLLVSPLQAYSQDFTVSPYASEIGLQRVGGFLFRYIVFSTKGCMRVELLDIPREEKQIVTQRDICGYEGNSFYTDVADASFEDIKITKDSFNFNLYIIGLRSVVGYDHKCMVKINGDKNSPMLSPMTCAEPVERVYSD